MAWIVLLASSYRAAPKRKIRPRERVNPGTRSVPVGITRRVQKNASVINTRCAIGVIIAVLKTATAKPPGAAVSKAQRQEMP
jgi:hypothetical protein